MYVIRYITCIYTDMYAHSTNLKAPSDDLFLLLRFCYDWFGLVLVWALTSALFLPSFYVVVCVCWFVLVSFVHFFFLCILLDCMLVHLFMCFPSVCLSVCMFIKYTLRVPPAVTRLTVHRRLRVAFEFVTIF